ncbi:piggyBac transposable element-derived protein 4-like [Hyperolius riggenbachi]|uniref:piggyBac transposable element-derived protein 4-like n=1 Tax=Hyperolius riggenbachi TaxID=752182 RepID=UPI0035A26756
MASSSKKRLSDQALMDILEDSDAESLAEWTDSEGPVDLSSGSESTSDSENENPVSDVSTWSEMECLTQAPPPRFPFTGSPGQKRECDHSPLAYLELFLSEEVIGMIVQETNRYAAQQLAAPLSMFSRSRRWEPVTSEDIWLFLSLVILQGVVGKPLQKWYWSTNQILATPFFGSVMPEYRFSLIMKYLHFTNNEGFDEASHPAPKLKKIWEIYQLIVSNFRTSYMPERHVTVDESIMTYKGRLSWVQFIASKRVRFGVRSIMLCESQSGYIWNSVVYTGKGTKFDPKYNAYGLATSSVLTLIEPLLDKGYCLTTDSFYTTPELYEHLLVHKTDAYGTVRPNRHQLPHTFSAKKLKSGEIVAWQKGKIMALRWHDKKDVSFLSTVHNAATALTRARGGKEAQKPIVALDYHRTMGDLDRADQALTFYPAVRKQQRKYYKKLFRHLLEQCLWNAFVLYKKRNDKPVPHHDFVWQICEAICVKHRSAQSVASRVGRRASYVVNPARLTGRHFVEYLPPTAHKLTPTRQCKVCCSKRGPDGKRVRKETRFYCPDCDVGLCPVPCFKVYHTKEVF